MKKKPIFKLKKGDKVWVRVPVNAIIKSVNQQYGYTLIVKEDTCMGYFDDFDVKKLPK